MAPLVKQARLPTLLVLGLWPLRAQARLAGSGAQAHPGQPRHGDLLSELEAHLGSDHRADTEARVARLEEALRPLFDSLPKSEEGLVGVGAARYALHRTFVQLHAWQVKGLEPTGGSWDLVSPAEALGAAPEPVRGLFEARFGSGGLGLHELSVLAASVEGLVHTETEARLRAALAATVELDPAEGTLSEKQADAVMGAYMATYILGTTVSEATPDVVKNLVDIEIHSQYPNWGKTKRWMREVREDVMPGARTFSFSNMTAVLEEVADRYGLWQASDCKALKNELMVMEDVNGSGRVRLADFYNAALKGQNWQFSESMEYLRQLGALDESRPDLPRLIIANYVNSPTNCVASLEYYGVCCTDECEVLLASLERRVGQPDASVEDILSLVSALPSATVPANRTLPEGLVRRLRDIADHHSGRVPLHGRLFAQWLHHAYPRECPYPHVSGTTSPKRASEWLEAGREPSATEEEMLQVVEDYRASTASEEVQRRAAPEASGGEEDGLCSPMWTMEEELVDSRRHEAFKKHSALRAAGLLASLLAAGGSVARLLRRTLANSVPADALPVFSRKGGYYGTKGGKYV